MILCEAGILNLKKHVGEPNQMVAADMHLGILTQNQ